MTTPQRPTAADYARLIAEGKTHEEAVSACAQMLADAIDAEALERFYKPLAEARRTPPKG